MKAAGSLFAIENKDVEAHARTSFWEKESLATTVNAAKTTMHKNIALNHFITRTKLIKGKCKSLIIISLKNMIIFLKKHVHVFHKSRTCFSENTYTFLPDHTTEDKNKYRNRQ